LQRVLVRREGDAAQNVGAALETPFEEYMGELMRTPEFIAQLHWLEGDDFWRFLGARPHVVDVDCAPEILQQMMQVVGRVWSTYGREAPYFSVLTDERYRGELDDGKLDEFYGTGHLELSLIAAVLDRCGVTVGEIETALELGCGVGRLSLWLSQLFPVVYGVDISRPHLELASAMLSRLGRNNFEPLHVATVDELARLPRVDFFYSRLVLQHNPPPIIKIMLQRLLANLNAGGVGIFQVPTCGLTYRFSAAEYVANADKITEMELHALPQTVVLQVIEAAGCQLLEVFHDQTVRDFEWMSQIFVVQKRR
jgi:SAM-dependent methyltransferase